MDLIDILKCTLLVIGIVILTPIVFSILFPIMSIFLFIFSIFVILISFPILIAIVYENPWIIILLFIIVIMLY